MRTETHTIEIYQFSELTEKAQEKAIQEYQEGQYNDPYWYEYVIDESIPELLKQYGLAHNGKIYFSLDRDHFISFEGLHIDSLERLLEKAETSTRKIAFFDLLSDSIAFESIGRNNEQFLRLEFLNYDRYNRIEKALESLHTDIEQAFQEMKGKALESLQKEFDHFTSEEHARESLEELDYEFLVDGSIHY